MKLAGIKKEDPKRKREKRDTVIAVVFLLTVVLVILALIFRGSGFSFGKDRKVDAATGRLQLGLREYPGDTPLEENIRFPGKMSLTLDAGTKTQYVNFENPAENTCYFRISLYLSEEDCIWTSDLLEPGCAFERITLERAPEAGTYEEAVLRYEAFAVTDQHPLNGAEFKLTVNVKEE